MENPPKVRWWRKHPWLIMLAAMVANLGIIFPYGLAGALIEERKQSKGTLLEGGLSCVLYALVFSVFAIALFLTGWFAGSYWKRFFFILGGSFFLMLFWFIIVLILVFIAMGVMGRLYS